ncbi:MAG: transaldolase family protein [Bacilli bacterium]
MILFIDTADIKEIEEASTWGYVKGVTTNPSLIAKVGLTQKEVITKITKLIDGPISAEVTASDYEGMMSQAHELFQIDPKHIVIKLPMTQPGLQAANSLYKENIPTNVTLCFSASQALLAMENHATYVSPFLGRLDDAGQDSISLISDIMQIKKNYGYDTKIICASIRNVSHIDSCALLGADIATVPYKVIKQLIKNPLTDAGLKTFEADAQKTAELSKK